MSSSCHPKYAHMFWRPPFAPALVPIVKPHPLLGKPQPLAPPGSCMLRSFCMFFWHSLTSPSCYLVSQAAHRANANANQSDLQHRARLPTQQRTELLRPPCSLQAASQSCTTRCRTCRLLPSRAGCVSCNGKASTTTDPASPVHLRSTARPMASVTGSKRTTCGRTGIRPF